MSQRPPVIRLAALAALAPPLAAASLALAASDPLVDTAPTGTKTSGAISCASHHSERIAFTAPNEAGRVVVYDPKTSSAVAILEWWM